MDEFAKYKTKLDDYLKAGISLSLNLLMTDTFRACRYRKDITGYLCKTY
jgi:hypothetical protein